MHGSREGDLLVDLVPLLTESLSQKWQEAFQIFSTERQRMWVLAAILPLVADQDSLNEVKKHGTSLRSHCSVMCSSLRIPWEYPGRIVTLGGRSVGLGERQYHSHQAKDEYHLSTAYPPIPYHAKVVPAQPVP